MSDFLNGLPSVDCGLPDIMKTEEYVMEEVDTLRRLFSHYSENRVSLQEREIDDED